MPFPRPPMPPKPPPPSHRERRALRERAARDQWRAAVHAESWRLIYAEGGRSAGAAEFARGEQSLLDQGFRPPPESG